MSGSSSAEGRCSESAAAAPPESHTHALADGMIDLSAHYGPDIASLIYMRRMAGPSFGRSKTFWWNFGAAIFVGAITALAAVLFTRAISALEDNLWLTEELRDGLPFDGSTPIKEGVTAYARWGGGEWRWLAYSVVGGAVVAVLKLISSALSVLLEGEHGSAFPKLSPNLIVEVGSLQVHLVHSVFVLATGAVSIGCGASVGPEAPSATFGSATGAAMHKLINWRTGESPGEIQGGRSVRGSRPELQLAGMVAIFATVFGSLLAATLLVLELNIATTVVSIAAVELMLAQIGANRPVDGSRADAKTSGASSGPDHQPAKPLSADSPDPSSAMYEVPHTKVRYDFTVYVMLATLASGVGITVYYALEELPFFSPADVVSEDLILDTGMDSAEALLCAMAFAWRVETWHYPVAACFGLAGAVLGLCAEVAGVIFEAGGLKLLALLERCRLSAAWERCWASALKRAGRDDEARAQDSCFSLGQLVQPLLGGVLVGLFNVLQPYCLGEGTSFIKYIITGTNNRTLTSGTLVGVGFVKLIATRVALGFGFVGGKFFPSMFLGGCVGCAIFIWCNNDGTNVIDLSDMPLLFPLTCLMTNTVVALAPIYFSIPVCVAMVFRLGGDQMSCLLISCASGYFVLHAFGKGLIQALFDKKLRLQIRLLREARSGTSVTESPSSIPQSASQTSASKASASVI